MLDIYLNNRVTPSARPFIMEPLVLELKALPSHLYYAFFRANNSFLVIIATDLVMWLVETLVYMLQMFKIFVIYSSYHWDST